MTAPLTRPEGALYRNNVDRKPLSTKMFYAKHLIVGILGEVAIRNHGLENTLSITSAAKQFVDYTGITSATKQFVDFTGISSFGNIPGASAQEVDASATGADTAAKVATEATSDATSQAATEAATEAAEATAQSWSDYTPTFVTDGLNSLHTHVWTPIATITAPATAYVAENSEWIAEAGGIALAAAAINRASQSRIKNAYVRNVASILGGAAIVYGTKLALSNWGYAEPVAFAKTVDMGARILLTHFVVKHATPLAQKALVVAHAAIDPLRAPFGAEKGLKAKTAE